LQLFYEGMNLDELFQGSAGAREPIVKAIVVRKKSQDLMIVSLQELINYPWVESST
jgi:hypothetical protein